MLVSVEVLDVTLYEEQACHCVKITLGYNDALFFNRDLIKNVDPLSCFSVSVPSVCANCDWFVFSFCSL